MRQTKRGTPLGTKTQSVQLVFRSCLMGDHGIVKCIKTNPRHLRITFDTQLKILAHV